MEGVLGWKERFWFLERFCSVSAAFEENIRYRVSFVSSIQFWQDRWVGDASLASSFILLFTFTLDRSASIKDCYGHHNNVVWCPQFQRDLEDSMVDG